jgi:hypothetical protein
MGTTPFPASPCDVAALTVPEFTCELDLNEAASIDQVCHRFLEDTNRALVWFIRFRALTSWCKHEGVDAWLRSEPCRVRRACEVAASFAMNDHWEFDVEAFRSAVKSLAGSG